MYARLEINQFLAGISDATLRNITFILIRDAMNDDQMEPRCLMPRNLHPMIDGSESPHANRESGGTRPSLETYNYDMLLYIGYSAAVRLPLGQESEERYEFYILINYISA